MAIITVKCKHGHVSKYDNTTKWRCRTCDRTRDKKRYHSDPEFRERKRAQTKANYERKKREHAFALSKPIQ